MCGPRSATFDSPSFAPPTCRGCSKTWRSEPICPFTHVCPGNFRRALGTAERWGLVGRNVAALVDGPRRERGSDRPTLSVEDAKQLLRVARGNRLQALFLLAVLLGLREGELLGLTWRDIDLDRRTLSVSGTLKRQRSEAGSWSKTSLVCSTPKTFRSRRTIPLPDIAVATLRVIKPDRRLKSGMPKNAGSNPASSSQPQSEHQLTQGT